MNNLSIKLQKAWMLVCLIEKYYESNPTGGYLHIVLDDSNYEDNFLQFCIEEAIAANDYWAEIIGRFLLEFSVEEREQIIERQWEIYQQVFP